MWCETVLLGDYKKYLHILLSLELPPVYNSLYINMATPRLFLSSGTLFDFFKKSPDLLQILWEGGWAYKENFSSPSFCSSSKTVAVRGKSAEH